MNAASIKICAGSHPGNRRAHNEDAVFFDEKTGLAVIADGMGGHSGGEVASQIVVDSYAQNYVIGADLVSIALDAHKTIVERSQSQPELRGMGSTLVIARTEPNSFQIVWAGDSRAYHWRLNHGMRQVTRDHSLVEKLLYEGKISKAEARMSPQSHIIMQALGMDAPIPETASGTWQQGDRLLLCSDGLNNELEDHEIESILNNNSNLDQTVTALIEETLKHGGRDNVSVILIENTEAI